MASQRHFPGLDGLRFVAAMMVLLHHVEIFKLWMGIPNRYLDPFLHPWLAQFGDQGVEIFFVLSGFLITHLLMEEQAGGRIKIGFFYVRRILRIWPLYFLMVFTGFFLLPRFGYPPEFHVKLEPYFWGKFSMMILLLPNFVLSIFGVLFPVFPLWSVGIEEQFYLVWPQLLERYRNRLKRFLVGFILICVLLKIGLSAIIRWDAGSHFYWTLGSRVIFEAIRFDALALGGLAACLLREYPTRLPGILFHPGMQMGSMVTVVALYGLNPELHAFHDLVYGILYAIVILNLAANPHTLLKLENRALNYLGRISYGIYLYHVPLVVAMILLLKSYRDAWYFDLALYGGSLFCTLGLAALSHRFFESPFLILKSRFSAGRI